MTTYQTETPPTHNGHPSEPPYGQVHIGPSVRREEKRRDRSAEWAQRREDRRQDREQRRLDREHRREMKNADDEAKLARKAQERDAREKLRSRRRRERRASWQAAQLKVANHMPLWGLPVVAVSMILGCTGQASAAAALGMGMGAIGIPVLTEGMTLTLAGLTSHAIEQKRPYRWLLRATVITAVIAAAINAAGHLIEDHSAAGGYRAGAYALASLAAVALWLVVMRSKKVALSKQSAEEADRWRRLGRRHPVLVRRARRLADNATVSMDEAYETVWTRANAASPDEPSIREIRAARRATYRRARAASWDGRRRWIRRGTPLTAVVPDAVEPEPEAVVETVSDEAPEVIPAPVLPVALVVPGVDGEWVAHRVPVHPLSASRPPEEAVPEEPTPRFPQGKEPVSDPVRDQVDDDRLETVRAMVDEVLEAGGDLMKEPSARKTAKRLGCRPGTARAFLATALAEHGITRPKRH
ncbi:hypothetical protein ACFQ2B_40645 [Streptomyces stramineus]|uniref:DUF2637 domain-containing protein n=1 Tax=Streptomyces stramineus TaxID=173861 RepID=A0ABP3JWW6_9ACTN